MSGEKANSVTHDNVGNEPMVKLWFPVIWANTGAEDNIVRNNGMSVISTTNVRDWDSFKRDLFAPTEHSSDDLVTYIDSDDDQIPIESQCEFDEALRIATNLATRKRPTKSLYLVVNRGNKSRTEITKKNIVVRRSTSPLMPPTNLNDDGQVFVGIQPGNETKFNVKETQPSDDTPPKWFTNYMQTMKEDIVAEVSTRVTKTVMEVLQKKRDSQYDSATSHPRASDPEYIVDSDSDDSISKLSPKDLVNDKKESDDPRFKLSPKDLLDDNKEFDDSIWKISTMDLLNDNKDFNQPILNICPENLLEDNKNVASSLHSGVHSCDGNSNRRHRNNEKQRKKHNKTNVEKVSNYRASTPQRSHNNSPFVRRNVCNPRNSQIEDSRGSLTQSMCVNSELSSQNLPIKNPRNNENFEESNISYDTPYRRMIASGIRQMSFTPVDTTDLLETPIIKLRLANSCDNDETNVVVKSNDDTSRMGCSITGNDMIDRPNDRVPEYFALSDSDNISIISDVSHNSEIQRISNSFEMINDRSMNFSNDENIDDFNQTRKTEFEEYTDEIDRCVNDSHEANRDSSSFELLSEPASPQLSIHMNEDHFSPDKKDTKNYNINDDTSINDKRGNQNKMESSTLAVDAVTQGSKIYQRNIIDTCDDDDESSKIILEKRTDGTYSFVADTLPGSTRESMIKTDCKNSSLIDETTKANSVNERENDDKTTKSPNETTLLNDDASFNDFFHQSTQSFHSHTSPKTENERQDFAGYTTTSVNDETPCTQERSHIFVDENVSKGLGDTRQSSPRKQEFNENSRDDFTWERPKTSRKQTNGGHYSSSTRRNGYTRQGGDRSRKFGNWSTTRSTRIIDDVVFNAVDPMHILPETLVSGAVHVAASAYTTARRVYHKILTAQMRKPADKSKFGRR